MAKRLLLTTPLGEIALALLPDAAPVTVAHVERLVAAGAWTGASFYRSDFVIQFGLHGTGRSSPCADLAVNESSRASRISNLKGTAAIAHWDIPDCGNSEAFISLRDSTHLDSAYGGYCVWARVAAEDKNSWAAIDAIASKIASSGGKATVPVTRAVIV